MLPIDTKKHVVAYIDESGNFSTSTNTVGMSSHYILVAVIIPEDEVVKSTKKMEQIIEKHFPKGELKSNRISNHPKRFQIIHDILDINFCIISVVVDKRHIHFETSGLQFKKSYVKYLNDLLHQELKLLYPYLSLVADEYGTDDFMKEFVNYVEEKDPQYSFISSYDFKYRSSKNEPLIQLADFIAGTISFGYEETKRCNEYASFYKLLRDRIRVLRFWPINNETYEVNLDLVNSQEYDSDIAKHCIRSAVKYIQDNEDSTEPFIIDRIHVLQYLLHELYIGNSKGYVYSSKLIDILHSEFKDRYSVQTFISQIIGPIRDNNVVLASSANGYKIPINVKEIFAYANKAFGQVIPILSRLRKARDRILAVTDNKLDIFLKDEYQTIKKHLDS